jgi:peptidoglycan/xylan/chitin deacetylase (PgdA/CDA1 family)
MGYKIVLWSLNSKDWVTFHDKQITSYILKRIRPGDIILFHDSGGVFTAEGGNRAQTIKTIPRLVKKLKERGYRFVTISELMAQPQP